MTGGLWCTSSPASAACCVGLPNGSQACEAEGSRVALPELGDWSATKGRGSGAKHLSQPWLRGKECSTAAEGSENKRQKETGLWWLEEPCCPSLSLLGAGLHCCPCLHRGPLL